jgi:hypothetical protein
VGIERRQMGRIKLEKHFLEEMKFELSVNGEGSGFKFVESRGRGYYGKRKITKTWKCSVFKK